MNLNNWKNWGTNLLIRFGLQDPYYAHGFSESDSVIENTQEEDSLSKTFFEWKIGKNWYKPWKWGGGRSRGGDKGGSADIEKARREAREKAQKEASAAAEKAAAREKVLADQVAAMKAAEEARRGKIATANASQLAIGPGAQDRVGDMKKRKQERRVVTQQTRKTRKPTVIAQGPTGGGAYGGAPVV